MWLHRRRLFPRVDHRVRKYRKTCRRWMIADAADDTLEDWMAAAGDTATQP